MLLVDDAQAWWRHRDSYDFRGLLLANLNHVHALQFEDGTHIARVTDYLTARLSDYAHQHSPVYRDHQGIISKKHLENKAHWYVEGLQSQHATTGGSTGTHFIYRRWTDSFRTIEAELHYRAILQEFNTPCNTLLYLMLDQRQRGQLTWMHRTPSILVSHGRGLQTLVHEVSRIPLYYENSDAFWLEVINYCYQIQPDVITIRGDFLATLREVCERHKIKRPLCRLLSHTGAKARLADFEYLQGQGLIEQWCDHMRCWDGGVTFFTCPHHTYHLLDGLAAVRVDDHRLVSTDFYSLPSPFIDYWNGDYASLDADYRRCACGRSYRPFTLDRTRTRLLSGVPNIEIRRRIIESGVDLSLLVRGEAVGEFLRLFTTRSLPTSMRETLQRALPELTLDFVVS